MEITITKPNKPKTIAVINQKQFRLKTCQTPNHSNKHWIFFYQNDLLEFYPIAQCMQKDFALSNEITTKIFSYCNKCFIFEETEKILDKPFTTEKNEFKNKISPSFTEKNLQHGTWINTNIAIPEINKTIFSQFNLQKALFNEKYIVVDCRHEILTIAGQRDRFIHQPLSFHTVLVFKREELLKIEDTIDICNLNPFLKIKLPIDKSEGFFMEISSFKDDTLIIKNKNQKSYIHIYLNDIPTNQSDTLTISITLSNTNLLEENLDQQQEEEKSSYFLNFFKNYVKKLITLLQMLKKFCQKIVRY